MALKVGFGLITCQLPDWAPHTIAQEYADALAMARFAEGVGFDSIWVSEHHFARDSYLPSPMALLAALSASTSHATLGTAIALAPLHQPTRFAEDCAVVDVLSDGRLIIGLGGGWRKQEFEALGVSEADRGRRTKELVEECRRAWSRDEGPHIKGPWVTPKPAQQIPILLGGTARAPIARAGRMADGYIGSPQNDLEAFRTAVGIFDESARAAGRDPRTLSLALHVNAWVSADGAIPTKVIEAMWHQIGTYAQWHAEDDQVLPHSGGSPPAMPPLDMEKLNRRTIFGTPDEVVTQTRPWIELFGDREFHFIFRLHYPGMRLSDAAPAIQLFSDRVIPRLRAIAPIRV